MDTSALRPPATFEQQVAISVVIAVFGVWSTAGNVLTILAITTRRYMRTKTNIFILSLSISDLLSGAVASPLWLYRKTWGFDSWEWEWFPCKLYWFVDETTSYCTAMHIASFAVWRYILVKWPHISMSSKIRAIAIWVGILWIVAMIFGGFIFSTFIALEYNKTSKGDVFNGWPMCSFNESKVDGFKTYYTFTSTTFMITPMILLFVMSGLIVKELFFTKKFKGDLRKARERRAARQLSLIATFFIIGYAPMVSYLNWTMRVKKENNSTVQLDYSFSIVAYLCLRFSECFNPIVYNVASNKMRKASKEVLSYLWHRCGLREPPLNSSLTSPRYTPKKRYAESAT